MGVRYNITLEVILFAKSRESIFFFLFFSGPFLGVFLIDVCVWDFFLRSEKQFSPGAFKRFSCNEWGAGAGAVAEP